MAWHGTQKTPLGKAHTHTGMEGQRRARLLRRRCARCTSTHARTHARTHMQHTATGPGCEGKEKRGKGGDSMGEEKKKGKGARSAAGALALDWHHLRACAPTRCPALHRSRLQKRPRGWVVREEERGELVCCGQGTEQKGKEREANNQQCTRKMHKNSHQQTLMLPQCTATHQQWWQGESVQQESAARGKSHQGARLHRKRRGRGRDTGACVWQQR